MNYSLTGKRVAILATDGFEQSELEQPRQALEDAGASTVVISPEDDHIQAWDHDHWGNMVEVDESLFNANPQDFDALLLPGGVQNLDALRTIPEVIRFVRAFFEAGKPVAAICHGPQLLIEADVVRDRKLTSFPSIKTDLINAGARWVDQVVVVDQGLVTSRSPADLPQFNEKMVDEFSGAKHKKRTTILAYK